MAAVELIESARVSSGFPGCTRDEGTAMNSVFNSISSIVLIVHAVMSVINSINNNNKYEPKMLPKIAFLAKLNR